MDSLIEEFLDDNSPVDMEEGVNNYDDDDKEITAGNEDKCVIPRDITDNENKIFRIPWIR